MKNNKGFSLILIVLIIIGVLALGVGAYYFLAIKAPNIDGIADWKTFRDNDIGFEIKYPYLWEAPLKGWFGGWTTGISVNNDNYCVVDVAGWPITSGSNNAEIENLLEKGYIKTSIKIDGMDGIRLTADTPHAGLTEAVYFEAYGNNFRIGRNRGFGDMIERDCIKDYNQILSTFKFLE